MPVMHGGLGLRSSKLIAPAAYWAAWADILPIIVERLPFSIDVLLPELEKEHSQLNCVVQAKAAEAKVTNQHFWRKPSWRQLVDGERKPQPDPALAAEPGIWHHGWQFHASSGLITLHQEREVLPTLDPASRARFRSQGGSEAGAFFARCRYANTPESKLGASTDSSAAALVCRSRVAASRAPPLIAATATLMNLVTIPQRAHRPGS